VGELRSEEDEDELPPDEGAAHPLILKKKVKKLAPIKDPRRHIKMFNYFMVAFTSLVSIAGLITALELLLKDKLPLKYVK